MRCLCNETSVWFGSLRPCYICSSWKFEVDFWYLDFFWPTSSSFFATNSDYFSPKTSPQWTHLIKFWILKYVSKCVTLIARFWNIFANSHLMDVISIVVDSKHYVDNFQSVFDAKTTKFHMKKECGKFDDFWKTISTKGTIHNIISLNIMSGKGHYTLF